VVAVPLTTTLGAHSRVFSTVGGGTKAFVRRQSHGGRHHGGAGT